jgi:hypothetical protein
LREPPDLHDLVGGDLPPDELERLRRVDALLRGVPAPPAEVPQSLTQAVAQLPLEPRSVFTSRRIALALAFAALLAAMAFGVGRWTADDALDARATVHLTAGDSAPGATAFIKLGERDEATGNWKLQLVVSGLPQLGKDGYYVLWLAKNGEYAATCGTFNVHGRTTVDMTASYRLADYDEWVISEAREDAPWLLSAKI